MRPRDALALVLLGSLVAAGCSRLTFVKPKAGRGSYEQVAPEYSFRSNGAGQQRLAVQDRIALAEQRLRAGQWDAAEADARAALKLDPRSADAHTLLAAIEDGRGRRDRAGVHYAKAAELAPTQGNALNNYGAWLCGNGRAVESLAWFDRAVADPRYGSPAAALANAGSCAVGAGQFARAERDLRSALASTPENPVALAAMAEVQFHAGRYMEARAFSERRLAAAPPSARVLQLASQIEEKLGDSASAARYVRRVRTEFPQVHSAQPGEGTQP